MQCRSGSDGDPVGGGTLTHAKLDHVFEPEPGSHPSSISRHDQLRSVADHAERGWVEVIVVEVRDDYEVNLADRFEVDGGSFTHDVQDASAQDRIGKEP